MPVSDDPIRVPAGSSRLPVFAALAQGFFCLVLGMWPVVSLASFEALAGPNADHWSLMAAALLLAGIGVSLLLSAIRRDIAVEVFVLGMVTALSLAGSDIAFVIRRRIPPVHLLDAVAELLFVALWGFAIRDVRRKRRLSPDSPQIGGFTEPRGPHATG